MNFNRKRRNNLKIFIMLTFLPLIPSRFGLIILQESKKLQPRDQLSNQVPAYILIAISVLLFLQVTWAFLLTKADRQKAILKTDQPQQIKSNKQGKKIERKSRRNQVQEKKQEERKEKREVPQNQESQREDEKVEKGDECEAYLRRTSCRILKQSFLLQKKKIEGQREKRMKPFFNEEATRIENTTGKRKFGVLYVPDLDRIASAETIDEPLKNQGISHLEGLRQFLGEQNIGGLKGIEADNALQVVSKLAEAYGIRSETSHFQKKRLACLSKNSYEEYAEQLVDQYFQQEAEYLVNADLIIKELGLTFKNKKRTRQGLLRNEGSSGCIEQERGEMKEIVQCLENEMDYFGASQESKERMLRMASSDLEACQVDLSQI